MNTFHEKAGGILLARSRVSWILPLVVFALLIIAGAALYSVKNKVDSSPTPVYIHQEGILDSKSVKIEVEPEKIRIQPLHDNNDKLPVHSILFLGLAVTLIFLWYILLPVVRVYTTGIYFSYWFRPSHFISFSDIAEVDFFYTKRRIDYYAESTRFVVTNGYTKRFLIRYYRNYPTVRAAVFEQLRLNFPSTVVNPVDLLKKRQSNPVESVSILGRPLLSLRGIMILGVIVGFGGHDLIQGDTIGFLIFLLLGWLFAGVSMNYFKVVDDVLIVQSLGFLLYRKRIPMHEILLYDLVSDTKAPDSIVLFCNNFRQYHFPAGSLYEKDWRKLSSVLEEAGINRR